MVAALTLLCIKFGLRKPSAIFMSYPALNLTYRCYTPSLLQALEDIILPHTFLKFCLECYMKD
jgi:hormone-sensitive lipase